MFITSFLNKFKHFPCNVNKITIIMRRLTVTNGFYVWKFTIVLFLRTLTPFCVVLM